MHLNEGKKFLRGISACDVTWGQRSNKQICCLAYNYRLKTDGTLKITGLVYLARYLHCTNYERSMSRDARSKVKKLIKFANIVQPKALNR